MDSAILTNGVAHNYSSVAQQRTTVMEETIGFVFKAAAYLQRHNSSNAYKLILCWSYGAFGIEDTNVMFLEANIMPARMHPVSDFVCYRQFIEAAMSNLAELEVIETDVEVFDRKVEVGAVRKVLVTVEEDLGGLRGSDEG